MTLKMKRFGALRRRKKSVPNGDNQMHDSSESSICKDSKIKQSSSLISEYVAAPVSNNDLSDISRVSLSSHSEVENTPYFYAPENEPVPASGDLEKFRLILRSLLRETSYDTESLRLKSFGSSSKIEQGNLAKLCWVLSREPVATRESLLDYLTSVQEYLCEEPDPNSRSECIRQVFDEMSRSNRQFSMTLTHFFMAAQASSQALPLLAVMD